MSFAIPVPVFISERHSRTHTSEGVRAAPAVLRARGPHAAHMREIRRKGRRKTERKDVEEEAVNGRKRQTWRRCACVFLCVQEKWKRTEEGDVAAYE